MQTACFRLACDRPQKYSRPLLTPWSGSCAAEGWSTWPGSPECATALETVMLACADLGVPLAMDKLEGLVPCLTFLGIKIDTMAGVLRLPQDKFKCMRATLGQWSSRRVCKRRELESLIGTQQHACKVIQPGRAFLRRLIDLLHVSHCPHHHIRLNQQFRADLLWWQTFASHWNGIASLPPAVKTSFRITSDASGQWGCGAWSGWSWFQFEWPDMAYHHHFTSCLRLSLRVPRGADSGGHTCPLPMR